MPSKRPDLRFAEIIAQAESIANYIADMDYEAFAVDQKTRDAVERCLQRISEAATRLGEDYFKNDIDTALWKGARSSGNVLRHDYDTINARIIWQTATESVTELRISAERHLALLRREGDELSS